MIDARLAFHNLREQASGGYETTQLVLSAAPTEQRIARDRARRLALTSAIGLAAAVGLGAVIVSVPWSGEAGPAHTAAPSQSASPDVTSSAYGLPDWCKTATVVPGKAVGDLGGFEGWFNGTQDAPCDEWEQQVQDHPDTVWINTLDNTMIEAYFRTSLDALGVYGHLGAGAVITNPDPSWPADSAVLIDARTGEVLSSEAWADMGDFDITTGHFATVEPTSP